MWWKIDHTTTRMSSSMLITNPMRVVERIISGGQTGADQGALQAARELGIPTGGTAPRGWLTEEGPRKTLLQTFGLRECRERGYPPRTKANVLNSDGTLIVGSYRSGGSALTAKIANDHGKPMFHVDPQKALAQIEDFLYWLDRYHIRTLNVAGNRESETPGLQQFTRQFLISALFK
jgi:hypothetical protein